MPWEKSFDVDKVRLRAMKFFWTNGFGAASMAKLLDHIGINRGSFYDTFGNKRNLFLETLELYIQRQLVPVLTVASPLSAKEAVASIFNAFFEASTGPGSGRGCFLVNSSLELGKQDDDVDAILQTTTGQVEGFFVQKLQTGQESGELSDTLHVHDLARTLTALIFGMRTLEKAGASEAMLRSISLQAQRLLD